VKETKTRRGGYPLYASVESFLRGLMMRYSNTVDSLFWTFDHVDVEATKTALATDDYVHSCWVSPSGDGIKALVQITNPERHRDHFRALTTYFDKQYTLEVDESGINESRACFESHDPDIIIKDEWKKFGAFST
jgi:hypothetical protein